MGLVGETLVVNLAIGGLQQPPPASIGAGTGEQETADLVVALRREPGGGLQRAEHPREASLYLGTPIGQGPDVEIVDPLGQGRIEHSREQPLGVPHRFDGAPYPRLHHAVAGRKVVRLTARMLREGDPVAGTDRPAGCLLALDQRRPERVVAALHSAQSAIAFQPLRIGEDHQGPIIGELQQHRVQLVAAPGDGGFLHQRVTAHLIGGFRQIGKTQVEGEQPLHPLAHGGESLGQPSEGSNIGGLFFE